MAQHYIKDVIKSMLNMNEEESEESRASAASNVPLPASEEESEAVSLDAAGLRSPLHGARGRSIKEFEEQLSGLRKENFNLKLRIYFLEERMGSNCDMDQEDAVKKNIELMVELEGLKKEVQEKQDLLCQAVKAMELEEDEHRKESEKKERDLRELRERLEVARQQCDSLQEELQSQAEMRVRDYFGGDGPTTTSDAPDERERVAHLEARIADLEAQLRAEQRERDTDQLRAKLDETEERLRDALCGGEAKTSALEAAQARIARADVELRERRADVATLKAQLEQKVAETKELQLGVADLQKMNDECAGMYETERKRNERNRLAIANRNAKIGELEGACEKYKTQAANLELKLETAVNEVNNMRGAPAHAEHSPAAKSLAHATTQRTPNCKSKGGNAAAGDEARRLGADELGAELVKYKSHVNRLEQDQLKACKIIQTMLETRKKNGKEIEELQRSVQKRDAVIGDLKGKLADVGAGGRRTPTTTTTTTTTMVVAEKKSIQERVSELNLTAAAPSTDTERAELVDEHDPHLLLEQYKQFINELDVQKQKLTASLNDKDVLIEALEAKYEDLYRDFKLKENRIVDLEFELLSGPDNDAALATREKTDRGSEKDSIWLREIEEKDKEMARLEEELAKRTTDLQGVINNELWQKNREIERLQKYVTSCDRKDVEIARLQKAVAESENKLLVYTLRIKEYEEVNVRERHEIQERLNTSNEDRNDLLMEVNELNGQLAGIVQENAALKEEARLSDALRVETQEVCAMLGKRLEEIATFLDALLQQKSVLGFLGHKQNRLLKQRVEQSLDLTRNLSVTLQMSADQSLLQLSNISELLNATDATMPPDFALSIAPDDDDVLSLTYRNTLSLKAAAALRDDQSEVIEVLRAQIDQLKGEIEIRDHELAQRMTLDGAPSDLVAQLVEISPDEIVRRLRCHEKSGAAAVRDHSDSESWSEPDRDVSKARIGLDDSDALKPRAKMISESTEMERPASRTPSKRSVGTICQLAEQLSQKDELLDVAAQRCRAIEEQYEQATRKYDEVCAKCANLEASNADLNKEYKELDNLYRSLQAAYGKEKALLEAAVSTRDDCARKSRDLEEKMRAAIDARTAAENDVVLLHGKIENLESYKAMFAESVETKTKFIENRVNELEAEKAQALRDVKAAEGKLDDAVQEIARITEKLLAVEYNHAKSTSTLIDDAEKEVRRRVGEVEKEFDDRVRTIEQSAQREVLRIREAAENIAIKYERDYVERSEMERLKAMIGELESVQDVLALTEQKVRQLEASEMALKQQLFDAECAHRSDVNDVRRELDAATLQVSQLQLEKTNVEEERARSQAQLKQYNEREELFETQVADLKNDFAQLKENFRRQLHAIETEKSHLEVKTSSLQALNADLQSQIVKLQCGNHRDAHQTHSAPPTPTGRILNMYLSKHQTYRQQPQFNDFYHRHDENIENVEEAERIHANSSPDLGIESDQGRFSSLETNVVARPLRPSIELAVSMSENLDVHAKNDNNCGNDKCSRAVKDMHNENSMLKKKLLKSNKLLEETLGQLAKANQRKREVEKNICKQIHKTSQVLKAARANLDSGSENELVRK